jgi:hypothetical protein
MAALQHPAITGDVKTVCSLLRTCKSWRAALQQCQAGHLNITMPPATAAESSVQSTQQFARFAGWLPAHAGLVASISMQGASGQSEQRAAFHDTAEQLLVFGLRQAAADGRPTATSAAGGAAAAAAAPPLQLRSFKSSVLRSPALLHALPAAALTRLELTRTDSWHAGHHNANAFAKGLARLTALRELELNDSDAHSTYVGDACLAAISQLTQLTKASLDASTGYSLGAKSCNLRLLPQQLQQLQLKAGNIADDSATLAIDHLTALQQLQLYLRSDPAPDSALPAGLTALTVQVDTVASDVQHLAIHQLAQLQQLQAVACLQQPEQLQQLSSLSKLTHIDLVYVTAFEALSAASTWRHLPGLKGISMGGNIELNLNEDETRALLEHLAAASSLQCLEINCRSVLHPAAYVCDYVTNLQQLQYLELIGAHPSTRAEALTLTKPTHLTALCLDGAAGVDDVAAVALAARLTKLCSLCLYDCCWRSAAALPVIATLMALTELHLCYADPQLEAWGHPLLSAEELRLLAPLKQLRELRCHGFVHHLAMEQLWDMRNGSWREGQ